MHFSRTEFRSKNYPARDFGNLLIRWRMEHLTFKCANADSLDVQSGRRGRALGKLGMILADPW
jgi:hypothetical protein